MAPAHCPGEHRPALLLRFNPDTAGHRPTQQLRTPRTTGIPGATTGREMLSFHRQPSSSHLGFEEEQPHRRVVRLPANCLPDHKAHGFLGWPAGHQPRRGAPAAPGFLQPADPNRHRTGMACSIPPLLEAQQAQEHEVRRKTMKVWSEQAQDSCWA